MTDHLKFLTGSVVVKTLPLYLLLGYTLSVFPVSAQNDTTRTKEEKQAIHEQDISLFGSDEILNVSIYLDLARFSKKPAKTDTFDSEMTIHLNETDSVNRNVTIKYRGISRFEICSFPPMQLILKKPLYSDSVKIKKLKQIQKPIIIQKIWMLKNNEIYFDQRNG